MELFGGRMTDLWSFAICVVKTYELNVPGTRYDTGTDPSHRQDGN